MVLETPHLGRAHGVNLEIGALMALADTAMTGECGVCIGPCLGCHARRWATRPAHCAIQSTLETQQALSLNGAGTLGALKNPSFSRLCSKRGIEWNYFKTSGRRLCRAAALQRQGVQGPCKVCAQHLGSRDLDNPVHCMTVWEHHSEHRTLCLM